MALLPEETPPENQMSKPHFEVPKERSNDSRRRILEAMSKRKCYSFEEILEIAEDLDLIGPAGDGKLSVDDIWTFLGLAVGNGQLKTMPNDQNENLFFIPD